MSRRGVPERIISGHVKNHKDGSMEKGGSLSVGRVGWFGEPKSLFSWQDFTILLFPDIAIMVIAVGVVLNSRPLARLYPDTEDDPTQ